MWKKAGIERYQIKVETLALFCERLSFLCISVCFCGEILAAVICARSRTTAKCGLNGRLPARFCPFNSFVSVVILCVRLLVNDLRSRHSDWRNLILDLAWCFDAARSV